MQVKKDVPIKLTNERVWRTYLGGSLLDVRNGKIGANDDHFPEEWVMSVVVSNSAKCANEGLSKIASCQTISLKSIIEEDPSFYLGEKHTQNFGSQLGVLVKLIDSAERLSIQVHPDRVQSVELFNSPYGKTECWHILETREINGQTPCVYLGFRQGISRKKWIKLFETQDIKGMLDCLHRFEVKPGDTFFVEGGVPHAIGPGCFLVEIQEPTDYTLRVDKITPSGFELTDMMCHQGLGFEKMFDCFHYEGLSKEEALKRWRIPHSLIDSQSGGTQKTLLGYEKTPFFKLNLLECTDTLEVSLPETFSGLYILEGEGQLVANEINQPIGSGEQFFIPAVTEKFSLKATPKKQVRAMHFFGPFS